MSRLFFLLEYLANAVWMGAIIMFAFAVAGTVFREAGSINLAGHLNGVVLQKLNKIEFSAAALLILSSLALLAFSPDERETTRYIKLGLSLTMLALVFYYGVVVTNRLEHLRVVEIVDFDNFDTTKQAFRDEFNVLHKRYTTLVSINLLLNIIYAALTVFGKKGT
ncbi:MAG: DUF4149 domain-containing protein [Chloroherpetonaceae bacterium]|nr:DUF4149 domain-containing protein [Chloroherpetonaceae bacterium]